ncbi:MAG: hypothetical protein NT033_03260, partial [Candidatus Omnitrophica bacterium]|nr:hypothetical protein [Candidatus Omnitrophota bacterium]
MAKVERLRSKMNTLRNSKLETRNSKCVSLNSAKGGTLRIVRFTLHASRFTLCLVVAAFLLITVCQGMVFAQPKTEPKKPEAKKAEPAPPQFNVGDFAYTSSNRRDPFEPIFLTNPKQPGNVNALKKGYELEELKLVG